MVVKRNYELENNNKKIKSRAKKRKRNYFIFGKTKCIILGIDCEWNGSVEIPVEKKKNVDLDVTCIPI